MGKRNEELAGVNENVITIPRLSRMEVKIIVKRLEEKKGEHVEFENV